MAYWYYRQRKQGICMKRAWKPQKNRRDWNTAGRLRKIEQPREPAKIEDEVRKQARDM